MCRFPGSMSSTYVEFRGLEIQPHVYYVDENYPEVLGIEVKEGRWFRDGENTPGEVPVVINQTLRDMIFSDDVGLGINLREEEDRAWKVIGTTGNFKYRGEFSPLLPRLFYHPDQDFTYGSVLIRVRPDADADFEAKLLKDLGMIAKGWTFEVRYLDAMRTNRNRATLVPMIIFGIISGFLIFNVALGLFGVLWQNISKRKQEIGVRRAMGATKIAISWQIIGEVLILAVLSLALGTFFAIQLPLLGVFQVKAGIYLLGILSAVLFILLLVFICAFYPSRQAARLHPALALHEE